MEVWEELRETIAEKLADLLGTYTFETEEGEVQRVAIHIFPPQLPQDRSVEGLEIIINRSPTRWEQKSLFSRDLYQQRTFTLFLIAHHPIETTEVAINRLLTLFPQAKVMVLPQSDRASEQTKIEITEFPKRKKRVL